VRPPARATIPIALFLLLALIAPAAAPGAERTVAVTASATLRVPNDSAGIGLAVARERRSRGAALQAVSGGLRRVIVAVQSIPGVGPGDVTTGRITVGRYIRGRRAVFRASEGIGVVLHEPDRAGDLVAAAIDAGGTAVSGPRYFVGDTDAAFGNALAAAFDKAKARATILASRAGATLGPAVTIDEGAGAELAPSPTSKAELPPPDCIRAEPSPPSPGPRGKCADPPPSKPGTSTVTATVRVVFALQ